MTIKVISPDTAVWLVIFKREYILLNKNNRFLNQNDILPLESNFLRYFALGHFKGVEYYCAEINADILEHDHFHTISLRQALSMLYPEYYAMGVKAYSVMDWDRNHQFCGRCAAPTVHKSPNFERVCTLCNLSFFPRISPSIIVLIYREDELIMARSPHFAPGIYALIAGFVEIGETLEEAIHREVKEEVGVEVKNIVYFGSQPWPFPDSLMIGFTAEYAGGDLVIDHEEIEDAGWYRYDNLPGRPSMPLSISARMLDDFVQRCSQHQNANTY